MAVRSRRLHNYTYIYAEGSNKSGNKKYNNKTRNPQCTRVYKFNSTHITCLIGLESRKSES